MTFVGRGFLGFSRLAGFAALGLAVVGLAAPVGAQVVGGTVALAAGAQPGGVAVNPASGKVYVAGAGNATVSVVDGASPLTAPVVVSLPVGATASSVVVNPATNTVYTGNGNGTVSAINGATNAVTSVTVGSGAAVLTVDAATNTVFVATADGTVTAINGATNVTSKFVAATSSTGPAAIAVNTVSDRVYVANKTAGTVTVLNGATGSVVATVTVGTSPAAIAVNPVTNKIFVANYGSASVSLIDGATSAVTNTIPVGSEPDGMAINVVTDQVYVANAGVGSVSDIDGASHAVTYILVGTSPAAVAVDAGLNLIYVVNAGSANVSVIAGATNTATKLTVGSGPAGVGVNPITHDVYVANASSASHSVTLISAAGVKVTAAANLGQSILSNAILNPATQQYFIQGGNGVVILNALTNTVQANVQLSYGGNNYSNYYLGGPMALNVLTDTLYVANEGFTGFDSPSNVTMINGQTFATASVAVGALPHQVAVNPVTNKVYVTSPQDGIVTIINGATNTTKALQTVTGTPGSQPWSVDVNPATNTVYVTNQQSEVISVINGDADFVTGYVPTASYSNQVLVDVKNNKFYALDEYVLQAFDGATNNLLGSVTPCYVPGSMTLNANLNKIYVSHCEDYTLAVVNTSTLQTTEYALPSGVFAVGVAPDFATGQAYLATDLSYGSTAADEDILVLDGATDAMNPIAGAAGQFFSPVVNPRDGSVYMDVTEVDGTSSLTAESVLLSKPVSVPLTAAIVPVTDAQTVANALIFETANTTPTFTATVTGGYAALGAYAGLSAANPVATELYYSVDGGETYAAATPKSGSPGVFTIQASALKVGPHTVYAYAAYGAEGAAPNGQSAGVGQSPEMGDVVGYSFYVVPPVLPATTITVSASPNPQAYGNGYPVVVTAQVASGTAGTFGGMVVLFDGTTVLQYGLTPDSTGKVTYSSPLIALTKGNHTLTASYYGDSKYASSMSAPYTEVIANPLPGTTTVLTASPNPQTIGGSVALTVQVSSATAGTFSGKIAIYDGTAVIASGLAVSSTGALSYASTTIGATLGMHSLTAVYSSDANYAGSTSAAVVENIVAAPTFMVTSAPALLAVSAGSAGTMLLTVTPANGFTGSVTLSCSGAPVNSTCVVSPSALTISSTSAQTATLTFTAHSLTAENRMPAKPWTLRSTVELAGLPLAAMLLMMRRRKSWAALMMVVLMLLPVAALSGCGGGSGGGGGGGTQTPVNTSPGSYSLVVTAVSGAISQTATVAVTVQ
jgi:YVTN family beta-propeller protein